MSEKELLCVLWLSFLVFVWVVINIIINDSMKGDGHG